MGFQRQTKVSHASGIQPGVHVPRELWEDILVSMRKHMRVIYSFGLGF
jgi:hypothetical protein